MAADAHDLYALTRNLDNLALQIEAIGPEVAKAKTIRDFEGDRKKNLLAEFVAPLLANGSGVAAAEYTARAMPEYQERFKKLSQDLMAAYQTLSKEGGLQARFEAARSILSSVKAQMAL